MAQLRSDSCCSGSFVLSTVLYVLGIGYSFEKSARQMSILPNTICPIYVCLQDFLEYSAIFLQICKKNYNYFEV
jgi:hypothetical protein